MNREQRLLEAFQLIAADTKKLLAQDGNLSTLSTTAKGSLVAAINEIHAALATAGTPEINDSAADSSTTETYSASKIVDLLLDLKDSILGGASAAYDTLQELNALRLADVSADNTAIGNLVTAVGLRVSVEAQVFSTGQKTQARANIDAASATDLAALSTAIGNTDYDFAAAYTAAKA